MPSVQAIAFTDLLANSRQIGFYGGFAYSHPALKEYDYFWRLDSNVRYLCVPDFDPAQYVIDNDLDYGMFLCRCPECVALLKPTGQVLYMPSQML